MIFGENRFSDYPPRPSQRTLKHRIGQQIIRFGAPIPPIIGVAAAIAETYLVFRALI